MSGDPTDEEPQSRSEEDAEGPADPQEMDATEPPEEERPDGPESETEPESDPDIPPEESAESAGESDENSEEDDAVETPDLAPQADLSESWASMEDTPEQYKGGDDDEELHGTDSDESDADNEEGGVAPDGDREQGEVGAGDGTHIDESDEEAEDQYTETKVVPDEDDREEDEEREAGETSRGDPEGEKDVEGDEVQPEAADDEEQEDDDEKPEHEGDDETSEEDNEEEDGEEEVEEDNEEEVEEDNEEEGEADDEESEQVEFHDDTTPIQRKTGPESDQEQPLADHIEEMIKRLAVVVIIAGLVSLLAFPFGEEFINFLWYSVLPSDISQPHVYHPLELVITQLKAASLLGLVLALPVFVYETYAFMRPGLYPHERRYYLAAVPTSLILAFVGLLFGYFLVLPAVMTYFLVYSRDVVDIAFALGQTFNLMLILLGYLALVFQIPLFIMLAIMMGLTTRTWLEDRRLIFWGAFLGISFLFSPDPTGMAPILVAATMIALFEGTLLLLRWTKRGG